MTLIPSSGRMPWVRSARPAGVRLSQTHETRAGDLMTPSFLHSGMSPTGFTHKPQRYSADPTTRPRQRIFG